MYIEMLNESTSLDWKIWSFGLVWTTWLKYRTDTGSAPGTAQCIPPALPAPGLNRLPFLRNCYLAVQPVSYNYRASAGCVPSTVAPAISNTASLPGDKINVVVVDHFYCCCWGAGIVQWLERRTRDWKVPGSSTCMSGGRRFFSRSAFCTDSYFGIHFTHVLPQ